jgi:hypothetical protein
MPYKNWGYSGERLFPIKTNNSNFSLRIWINNSTSVDRIISVSKDTLDDYKGYLVEYGNLYNPSTKKCFYKESVITPKSNFSTFIRKIDDLNLFTIRNKPTIGVAEHQPISIYVVEIKRDSLYNIFKFETYYPDQTDEKDKYQQIEKLLFDEFNLFEKFRFKQNGS